VRPRPRMRHDLDERGRREALLPDQPEHIIHGADVADLP
jgi:hypothetical protein